MPSHTRAVGIDLSPCLLRLLESVGLEILTVGKTHLEVRKEGRFGDDFAAIMDKCGGISPALRGES